MGKSPYPNTLAAHYQYFQAPALARQLQILEKFVLMDYTRATNDETERQGNLALLGKLLKYGSR